MRGCLNMSRSRTEACLAPEGREEGFAMVMVIFIVTMMAVLGAVSMIMAIYSLNNAQGLTGSGKAFDAAESGLSAAHAQLARDLMDPAISNELVSPSPDPENPSVQANPRYEVHVDNDTPGNPGADWTITSTGTYEGEDDLVYTRKLEEKVTFVGTEDYFNAMNYVLYSENGTVDLSAGGLWGFSDFHVNGNIYGHDVVLENIKAIIGGGNMVINGNIYAYNNCTLTARTLLLAASTLRVTGGSATIETLGEGVFANNEVTLSATTGFLASAHVRIDDDCTAGNIIDPPDNHRRILGITVGQWTEILGTSLETADDVVPEVALPEPDFDWYRAQAKIQDADEYSDGTHYYSNPAGVSVAAEAITNQGTLYNGWIAFCEGDLTITKTTMGANTKGVFVSMGDVHVSSNWFIADTNSEYQIIAKGQVIVDEVLDFTLNPLDTVFIYSGYNGAGYAVSYPLCWFKDLNGQITARGSIEMPDGDFGIIQNTGITYRRPSVPVAGFPIPFKVKSWKVVQ